MLNKIKIYGIRLTLIRLFSKLVMRLFKKRLVNDVTLTTVVKFEQVNILYRLRKLLLPILNKFENKESKQTQSMIPKIAWICWLQGYENAPNVVKVCINSVKKNSGLEVKFISNENIEQFIEIPSIIKKKLENGVLSQALYSDYIRCKLLSKYGGVWFDSTCLCVKNPPEQIFQADVYSPMGIHEFNYKGVPSVIFPYLTEWTSYLIGSKPESCTYSFMSEALEYYLKNFDVAIDYYLVFYIAKLGRKLIPNISREYETTYQDNRNIEKLFEKVTEFNSIDNQMFNARDTWAYKLSYKDISEDQLKLIRKLI